MCAEGVLENADRVVGKHTVKTGMDYLNIALRALCAGKPGTDFEEKNGSGIWICIFCACRSDPDMHFLLISVADPIQISDRDISVRVSTQDFFRVVLHLGAFAGPVLGQCRMNVVLWVSPEDVSIALDRH